MIVVDTNVLAYLWIPGERTAVARALVHADPDWQAPHLWKSEYTNVLVTLVRTGALTEHLAVQALDSSERQMTGNEHAVDPRAVLRIASTSGCSAYDCEFVALARHLGVPLVTADRRLAKAFPGEARLLESAVEGLP